MASSDRGCRSLWAKAVVYDDVNILLQWPEYKNNPAMQGALKSEMDTINKALYNDENFLPFLYYLKIAGEVESRTSEKSGSMQGTMLQARMKGASRSKGMVYATGRETGFHKYMQADYEAKYRQYNDN